MLTEAPELGCAYLKEAELFLNAKPHNLEIIEMATP
jgi:hypothetical protein